MPRKEICPFPTPRKFKALVQKAISEAPLAGTDGVFIADFDSYCGYRNIILCDVAHEVFFGYAKQLSLSWLINTDNISHHVLDAVVEEVAEDIENNNALWAIVCDAANDELKAELKRAYGRKWRTRYSAIFADVPEVVA